MWGGMKTAIVKILARIIAALYLVYQFIFGVRAKTWLADRAWFWPDAFAPAGFFEPIPLHMPPLSPIAGPGEDLSFDAGPGWFGWLNPLVLLQIRRTVRVVGTVMLVELRPADATWYHDTFYLRPDDALIMNRFAPRCGLGIFSDKGLATLKCWVPIGTQLPKVGERIVAEGTLCADLANRWIGLAAGGKRWAIKAVS